MKNRLLFKIIVILSLVFSNHLMSSEKFCPEKPIDNCPEGFICQQLEPVKGKELKDKMAQLEEE